MSTFENEELYYIAKMREIVRTRSEALGRPMTACVVTFGCQMNARDSEKLEGVLSRAGFVITQEEDADFLIYNTCTVRDNADQRVFGRLGRVSHYKKRNPMMKVAVCGCMMQEASNVEKIKKSYPFVDLIFGTHNLYQFPRYLCGTFEGTGRVEDIWEAADRIVEDLPIRRKYSYKSGINIMFGCNNFCSYCIVPYVRGRERSREPREILREVETLAADGVKEIMLLGQNVNSYGTGLDTDVTFPMLLNEAASVKGIRRVRFMTPHPKDFSPDLIRVIRDNPVIARHVHLPLQSGSDSVLKRMNGATRSSSTSIWRRGSGTRSRTFRSRPTSSSGSPARPRRMWTTPSTSSKRSALTTPIPSFIPSAGGRPPRAWRTRSLRTRSMPALTACSRPCREMRGCGA